MSQFDVAVIGTGPRPDDTRAGGGYSMGYRHARGYLDQDEVGFDLVACADLAAENAEAFAAEFGVDRANVYENHREMLAAVGPDVVSVCTPPGTHRDIVEDCAAADGVRAVHCEKPLATGWGDCREMAAVCDREGVQLTVNVQSRCSSAVRTIRGLVADGAVGDLRRVEAARLDLMQTGVHQLDNCNFVVGDRPEWVLGAVEFGADERWYTGMHSEEQALVQWSYGDGVHGVAFTGEGGADVVGGNLRAVGTDGELVASVGAESMRLRRAGDAVADEVPVDWTDGQANTMTDVGRGLLGDGRPDTHVENVLPSMALVFGAWESARRRGRVEFPLDVEGNPLERMVEGGAFG